MASTSQPEEDPLSIPRNEHNLRYIIQRVRAHPQPVVAAHAFQSFARASEHLMDGGKDDLSDIHKLLAPSTRMFFFETKPNGRQTYDRKGETDAAQRRMTWPEGGLVSHYICVAEECGDITARCSTLLRHIAKIHDKKGEMTEDQHLAQYVEVVLGVDLCNDRDTWLVRRGPRGHGPLPALLGKRDVAPIASHVHAEMQVIIDEDPAQVVSDDDILVPAPPPTTNIAATVAEQLLPTVTQNVAHALPVVTTAPSVSLALPLPILSDTSNLSRKRKADHDPLEDDDSADPKRVRLQLLRDLSTLGTFDVARPPSPTALAGSFTYMTPTSPSPPRAGVSLGTTILPDPYNGATTLTATTGLAYANGNDFFPNDLGAGALLDLSVFGDLDTIANFANGSDLTLVPHEGATSALDSAQYPEDLPAAAFGVDTQVAETPRATSEPRQFPALGEQGSSRGRSASASSSEGGMTAVDANEPDAVYPGLPAGAAKYSSDEISPDWDDGGRTPKKEVDDGFNLSDWLCISPAK